MISNLITIGSSNQTIILISIIVVITIVDSQLINVFYGTGLDTPGDLHMLLFISFIIIASIISTIILVFVKRNDSHARTSRPSLFKAAYVGTTLVQYSYLNHIVNHSFRNANFPSIQQSSHYW